jgi:Ku protein
MRQSGCKSPSTSTIPPGSHSSTHIATASHSPQSRSRLTSTEVSGATGAPDRPTPAAPRPTRADGPAGRPRPRARCEPVAPTDPGRPGHVHLQAAGVGDQTLAAVDGPHVAGAASARQRPQDRGRPRTPGRCHQGRAAPATPGQQGGQPGRGSGDGLGACGSSAIGKNAGMPRAIWSGSVSFGLVNVPVKLVSATSPKDVRFHQLHDADGGRISRSGSARRRRGGRLTTTSSRATTSAAGATWSIEPDELASIDVAATGPSTSKSSSTWPTSTRCTSRSSYYLVPDGRAEKPYALLVETMTRSGKVAIGRFVLRTKQYLATLRARDGVLVLATMLFDDEVVAQASWQCRQSTPRRATRSWRWRRSWSSRCRPRSSRASTRRLPRQGARPDRGQGGRRDHHPAGSPHRRPRSWTSWPPSKPAWPRRKQSA